MDIAEIVLWVVLFIIVVLASCIRLAFIYPEKADKPIFWIKSAAFTVIISVIAYVAVKVFDL